MATTLGFTPKRIKQVTLPTFKLLKNRPYYFKFTTPMALGKEIPNSQMGRATVMQGIDLETGEMGIVLCATVLQKELNENYPDEGYVGKCFELVLSKVPEKRYNVVTISEIADPTEEQEWKDNMAILAAQRRAEANPADDDGESDEDPEGDADADESPEDEGETSVSAPAPKARGKATAKKAAPKRRR